MFVDLSWLNSDHTTTEYYVEHVNQISTAESNNHNALGLSTDPLLLSNSENTSLSQLDLITSFAQSQSAISASPIPSSLPPVLSKLSAYVAARPDSIYNYHPEW